MQKVLMLGLIAFAVLALVAMQSVRAEDNISASNYYAAYYDGHYGPISEGYWGRRAQYFWFKDREGVWRRDDAGHFKHEIAAGFSLIHGSGAPRMH
jgi:hypothetical protein